MTASGCGHSLRGAGHGLSCDGLTSSHLEAHSHLSSILLCWKQSASACQPCPTPSQKQSDAACLSSQLALRLTSAARYGRVDFRRC
mmetsp:Transcript_30078/g.86141  ORF Transcript_30078/g.86141 Transcript_30078/m.86141 type:complete len:86 (-) Transcript_30078:75-332(-)